VAQRRPDDVHPVVRELRLDVDALISAGSSRP